MNKAAGLSNAILCLSFLILFSSCLTIRPGSSKSGKNLYETFYVGEEGMMYFIKPLDFRNRQNEENLAVDFTFKYKDQVKDSATVNFTITAPKNIKRIEGMNFVAGSIIVHSKKPDMLFNESKADIFVSRFTAKLPLNELLSVFDSPTAFSIQIRTPSTGEKSFEPTPQTIKKIRKLNSSIGAVLKD